MLKDYQRLFFSFLCNLIFEKKKLFPYVNQRLYKKEYEKTKAKVTVPPDMLDVVECRKAQKSVSEIDYRKYLHQWICLPDMQTFVHSRKVNEQFSDVSESFFY